MVAQLFAVLLELELAAERAGMEMQPSFVFVQFVLKCTPFFSYEVRLLAVVVGTSLVGAWLVLQFGPFGTVLLECMVDLVVVVAAERTASFGKETCLEALPCIVVLVVDNNKAVVVDMLRMHEVQEHLALAGYEQHVAHKENYNSFFIFCPFLPFYLIKKITFFRPVKELQ